MILKNEQLKEVSFPLGGIGAGCIGLAGNGGLIDFEIFNHPNKGSLNGMTHFAVRAEKAGKVVDARILQGDYPGTLTGNYLDSKRGFTGYGFGPSVNTMAGLPHFRECVFDGEFPCARITLKDPNFPGQADLFAWSPLIPGDSFSASLPCGGIEYTIFNTTSETLDYTLTGVLMNPWDSLGSGNHGKLRKNGGRLLLQSGTLEDPFQQGEIALDLFAENAKPSMQEYLYRGGWCDKLEVYWHELNTPGNFTNRTCPEKTVREFDGGLLAVRFTLSPGEVRTVRSLLVWYIPDVTNTWDPDAEKNAAANHLPRGNRWKNWYAVRFSGAASVAEYLTQNYARLREGTERFRRNLFSCTIPRAALDGVSANLAILKSPTVLRLEDGSIWGWEGVASRAGSCEGTCQHVWNYAQALPFFFPDLERSIRRNQLRLCHNDFGGSKFRLSLPLGIRNSAPDNRSCADGAFGEIMKLFRDWKISGDTEFLKELWPHARKMLEYTWSEHNFDRWDPEKTGVLTGRQHHTLDMELFGPSGWLNGHYLGALKAASEMADVAGEPEFAGQCRSIFEKGKIFTEKELFNGEYYFQKIDLKDRRIPDSFFNYDGECASCRYWDGEHGEIKYQIGSGCSIDSHLGQWYASLYGIGEVMDPEHIHSTLNAIYRYNFRPSVREFPNVWRLYTVNDEGGVVICSWPKGNRPAIPIPYNTETMAGFEWAFACHLIMNGELEKGRRVAESIRARYDGARRNPWNEMECGSNYARSMAACAMLNAYSGFQADMVRKTIHFAPKFPGDFRILWSLGTAWGMLERKAGKFSLQVLGGTLDVREIFINGTPFPVKALLNAGDGRK